MTTVLYTIFCTNNVILGNARHCGNLLPCKQTHKQIQQKHNKSKQWAKQKNATYHSQRDAACSRKTKQMMNPVALHYMPDRASCSPVAVFLFAFAVQLYWARYVTVLPECVQFLYMLVDGNIVNFP